MKKHITLLMALFIIISVFSQNSNKNEQNLLTIPPISQHKNFVNDTLWVIDSSCIYLRSSYYELSLYNTFKVLSRNNDGNPVKTISFGAGKYSNDIETDSIEYFYDTIVKKRYGNIWDSVDQIWLENEYTEFESPGLLKEQFDKGFSNSSQYFQTGCRYLYKNSNNLTDTCYEERYDTITKSWKPKLKSVYNYDENGMDTLRVDYSWSTDQYKPVYKNKNSYENGNLTTHMVYIYDNTFSTWAFYYKVDYEYNSDDLILTFDMKRWDTEDSAWVDHALDSYTYDEQGRPVKVVKMSVSYYTQLLDYQSEVTYTYTDDSRTTISKSWDSYTSSFVNYKKTYESYIYDKVTDSTLIDYWDYNSFQWKPTDYFYSEFDRNKNLVKKTLYSNLETGFGINWVKDYYWLPIVPNFVSQNSINNSLVAYPNPTSIFVKFVLPENISELNSDCTISIYSTSGTKVAEIPFNSTTTQWDCENVESGIYFYTTIIEGIKYAGKIIVK